MSRHPIIRYTCTLLLLLTPISATNLRIKKRSQKALQTAKKKLTRNPSLSKLLPTLEKSEATYLKARIELETQHYSKKEAQEALTKAESQYLKNCQLLAAKLIRKGLNIQEIDETATNTTKTPSLHEKVWTQLRKNNTPLIFNAICATGNQALLEALLDENLLHRNNTLPFFRTSDESLDPLMIAILFGHNDLVTPLINYVAEKDRPNYVKQRWHHHEGSHTTLHFAIDKYLKNPEKGLTAITRLLQNGANPNALYNGKTPLIHKAINLEIRAQYTQEEIEKEAATALLNLLLKHGANINAHDAKTMQTPLPYALLNGATTTAKILLEKGASQDEKVHVWIDDKTKEDLSVKEIRKLPPQELTRRLEGHAAKQKTIAQQQLQELLQSLKQPPKKSDSKNTQKTTPKEKTNDAWYTNKILQGSALLTLLATITITTIKQFTKDHHEDNHNEEEDYEEDYEGDYSDEENDETP